MNIFLPVLYAFVGSMAFCFIFNIRGSKIFFAALGGALGWLVYLLVGFIWPNDVFQYFIAAMFIAAYAELFARWHKVPAILYLVVASIPLVPGSGIYYTMEYCIRGNTADFMSQGIHTISIAGAIAMGILVITSFIHIYSMAKRKAMWLELQMTEAIEKLEEKFDMEQNK